MKEEFKLLAWGIGNILNMLLVLGMIVGGLALLIYLFSSREFVLTFSSIMIFIGFGFLYIAYKQH